MATAAFNAKHIITVLFKLFLDVGGIQKHCAVLLYNHVIANRIHQDTLFIP